MKKIKLKQSVKDAIQLAIVILVLIMLIGIGLFGMKKRTEQIESQTKKTEMLATDQSK